eukprot:1351759-Pyramimonas_sp.AAC.1
MAVRDLFDLDGFGSSRLDRLNGARVAPALARLPWSDARVAEKAKDPPTTRRAFAARARGCAPGPSARAASHPPTVR